MSYTPITSNTLLSYALDTLPDPLQASPATGNTVYAVLTFSISNNSTTAVSLSKLQFQLPIGTLAQDLTAGSTTILCSASPAAAWDISINASGLCTATPSSGSPVTVTTDGIIMQLYNIAVNQQTGTVSITVTETASNSGSAPTNQSATFDVAKFPYGFFFTNFAPNVAQVADQGTVTLTWEGSDQASYMMTYGGAAPVDVSNVRSWTSPALATDTTFLLTASVISLGQTVTTTLNTTVIVSNPEITAASLSVSGISSLQATTIGGTLNANGTVAISGAATLNNSLSVSGASTLSSLTVNQLLTASGGINSGAITAAALTVNGNAAVSGRLAIGNLQTLGAAVQIYSGQANWSGSYQAGTDGLVCGYVAAPNTMSVPSVAVATGQCNGVTVTAQGGTICVLYSGGSYWTYTNTNSFTLPVPSGAQFSIGFGYPGNTGAYPVVTFYWIPFGSGGVSPTATEVNDDFRKGLAEMFSTITTVNNKPRSKKAAHKSESKRKPAVKTKSKNKTAVKKKPVIKPKAKKTGFAGTKSKSSAKFKPTAKSRKR